ncbi:B3 domain-containing protein Os06g0112300-like isoform X2 [Solanum dulcamara]|nr:B3 domain-containing protein Os06g0112300-like isoform X2 [Solanum dulcamara]
MKQPEIESSGIPEIDNGEYWPLSGKPYVDLILTKTSVKPAYSLYLPKKMNNELPSAGARAVLTCGQKKWDMFYGGIKSNHKFSIEWRKFVDDNNLKEGDGLVFELSECSASIIHFRVQILRGDFPAELKPEDAEGANSDNPIVLG